MVALHALVLGRAAAAVDHVREHRLADVDAAVVDEVDLAHLGAVGAQDPGGALAEGVVAQVAEVEGLVGIGAGELDHDPGADKRRGSAVGRSGLDGAASADAAIDGLSSETLRYGPTALAVPAGREGPAIDGAPRRRPLSAAVPS